jgi:dihydroneopterin triphosphate diphosphatase
MPGPTIRSDIVEVYVFRRPQLPEQRGAIGVELLQLRRCKGPVSNTWQPVMGHVEAGETAVQGALRELSEETGYGARNHLLNVWQLESVNTFFMASLDAIVMAPGFAAEVSPEINPTLDDTHDAYRWIARDTADRAFLWPGQRRAVVEIIEDILPPDSPTAPILRLPIA